MNFYYIVCIIFVGLSCMQVVVLVDGRCRVSNLFYILYLCLDLLAECLLILVLTLTSTHLCRL